MIIPNISWEREIGLLLDSPGVTKVSGPEGGLPNFDDGYFQGIPLGGFGAGTLSQTYRGDFSVWNLEVGKHVYKTVYTCQFGFFEDGKAFILNECKPEDGSLSSWNFVKQKGTYHAAYPIAYFNYKDLNLICEQFSPIIAHNYHETSYPVAIFRWHVANPRNINRKVSLLWSFESIFGSNENIFCQESTFGGLIFDNLAERKSYKYGQMGMFVQSEDVEVSYLTVFNAKGDGKEVWDSFSKKGVLPSHSVLTLPGDLKNSPGAICAKVGVKPFENKVVTFVLVWDYPIVEFGFGTKWYKYYTKHFGKDGRQTLRIARKVFNDQERWLAEVKKWQKDYLEDDLPDWFKVLLINELYSLAGGGTIWTFGKVEKTQKVSKLEEHFGLLECFDYPFYETLDVRFYGSFPLLKLWPRLEKLVMKDYMKAVFYEDNEKKFYNHPLDKSTAERKLAGAVPHDLGAPYEDPFIKVNSYAHTNINLWKDLNSKFVLLVYRDFYLTGKNDFEFLKQAWPSVVEAIKYLKQFDRDNDCLIENDNLPDQTYDNWTMSGPSVYCNGLWLCALRAAVEIAKVLDRDCKLFASWFEVGKLSLESKLWGGDYYFFDTKSEHGKCIMADQLCGEWYASLLDLGEIFSNGRVLKTLGKIFNFNVKKIQEGSIGAINGINPDGSLLPESRIWKLNTQSNEIWSGVTLALASLLYIKGFKEEAMEVARGVFNVVYDKKGYWFRTPEAWDIKGDFRASLYQRSGAVWAFAFHR